MFLDCDNGIGNEVEWALFSCFQNCDNGHDGGNDAGCGGVGNEVGGGVHWQMNQH